MIKKETPAAFEGKMIKRTQERSERELKMLSMDTKGTEKEIKEEEG